MKAIQCAHPPHHRNGFVATCRLWTASGGVHALNQQSAQSDPSLLLMTFISILRQLFGFLLTLAALSV